MNKDTDGKKLLLIGLIGAIITVIGGELPLGWYTNPDLPDRVMAQFAGYGSVSDLQLALGVFFGGIGIALQGLGYEGISKIIGTDSKLRHPSKIIHIGALACGSLGPLKFVKEISFSSQMKKDGMTSKILGTIMGNLNNRLSIFKW